MKRAPPQRVLIVEDDALLAAALVAEFTAIGCADVRSVGKISIALQDIAAFRPEVLVLDVQLTDSMEGWSLAEIASHLYVPAPRIVFSTGNPDVIPAKLRDGHSIMVKPYMPQELVQSVSGMADRVAMRA